MMIESVMEISVKCSVENKKPAKQMLGGLLMQEKKTRRVQSKRPGQGA